MHTYIQVKNPTYSEGAVHISIVKDEWGALDTSFYMFASS